MRARAARGSGHNGSLSLCRAVEMSNNSWSIMCGLLIPANVLLLFVCWRSCDWSRVTVRRDICQDPPPTFAPQHPEPAGHGRSRPASSGSERCSTKFTIRDGEVLWTSYWWITIVMSSWLIFKILIQINKKAAHWVYSNRRMLRDLSK